MKKTNALVIIHKLMKLGYSRSMAGILSKPIYDSIKWNDPAFINIAMKMHKDNSGLWMDDPKSTVRSQIKELFNI